MIRTVTVGPLPIYFGNVNTAMGLRGHHHTAQVHLVYGHRQGDHGYPSFLDTNNEIRERLESLTGVRNTFRDATNEDVAHRLWQALVGFTGPTWRRYGGRYWLQVLHLDVEGVQDDIGHDNGSTRYTVSMPPGQESVILPEDLTPAEVGRQLASQRDDLIAQGIDPAALAIPIHPGDPIAPEDLT